MTNRDGYDLNTTTGNRVNGRDLWSLRTTIAFEPAPWFRANAIWERFSENDNRSRTGKQLCTEDPGRTQLGNLDLNTAFPGSRSEEHTSELQSLMRISYAVFCLKK